MSRADELVELIRGRIHSEFDGECHLTDTEAHEIADFLSEAEQRARREALEEAAKVARHYNAKPLDGEQDVWWWQSKAAVDIATAIRALIPSEPHDAEGRE